MQPTPLAPGGLSGGLSGGRVGGRAGGRSGGRVEVYGFASHFRWVRCWPSISTIFGCRFKMCGRFWFGSRDSVIGVANGDSGGGIITACRVAAVSPIDPQNRMLGHGQ